MNVIGTQFLSGLINLGLTRWRLAVYIYKVYVDAVAESGRNGAVSKHQIECGE